MLEESYEIFHILDPRLTMEQSLKIHPDIILVDLEMPHLSGTELSRMLSTDDKFSSIPIIMMTASFTDTLYLKAVEAGAGDILSKSSTESMITNKISAVIRQKQLIQKEIQTKQLDAVRALIATNNHEFNNALFISNQYIKKLQSVPEQSPIAKKYTEKISEMNERMLNVVKNLSTIETVLLSEDYDSHLNEDNIIPMLKI